MKITEKIYWLEEWNSFAAKTPGDESGRILHLEEVLSMWDEQELFDWTVDAWTQMEHITDECDEREGEGS